jgi:hypothetical protein
MYAAQNAEDFPMFLGKNISVEIFMVNGVWGFLAPPTPTNSPLQNQYRSRHIYHDSN